jgi:hypothetical protein
MSAALQLPLLWAANAALQPRLLQDPQLLQQRLLRQKQASAAKKASATPETPPAVNWAFYRKHTENLLRRYLYASFQIGRSPTLLIDSVERGWASSRSIRTFEDALIFVLDVERCLKKLSLVDLQLIGRVVVQEYTHTETAALLGISLRTVDYKLPLALDRLTESLVESQLLNLPE